MTRTDAATVPARATRLVLMMLAWALVVGVCSGLAWLAISRAGGAIASAAEHTLPMRPPATTAATPSHHPTHATSASSTPAATSFTTPGGTVTADCGHGIRLRSATPRDGFRVDHEMSGGALEVSFGSVAAEYEVRLRCDGTTPVRL